MKTKLFATAFAAFMLASCASKPGDVTKITGVVNDAAVTEVKVFHNGVDTTLAVTDGKFYIELPADVASYGMLMSADRKYGTYLISDGTEMELVFENEDITMNSKPEYVQSAYSAYSAKAEAFAEAKDTEGAEALWFETVKANPANAIATLVVSDAMYELVKESAQRNGVDVYAFNTGLMDDLDFGTGSNKAMELPKVALITGRGMGVAESGEIWFLLDRRFGMPPALIDFNTLHKADLDKYNVIILAGGSPSDPISDKAYPNLKKWVNGGGTLILTGSSHSLASKIGVAKYKPLPSAKKKGTKDYFKPYYKPSTGGNNIEGVILNCKLDLTSPLGWGYSNPDIAIIKSGTTAFNVEETDGSFPLYYSKEPYLSGCISDANIKRLAQTPACMVSSHGSGTVICFPDDLNFRSYWFGATKIFMNAIFFGQLY